MNIIEAAKLMKADKKVRRRSWISDEARIYMYRSTFFDIDGYKYVPEYDDLTADDWEVYEETEYFDFFEAMERLKNGKKVSNEWIKPEYYYYYGIIQRSGDMRCNNPINPAEYNSKRWYEVE